LAQGFESLALRTKCRAAKGRVSAGRVSEGAPGGCMVLEQILQGRKGWRWTAGCDISIRRIHSKTKHSRKLPIRRPMADIGRTACAQVNGRIYYSLGHGGLGSNGGSLGANGDSLGGGRRCGRVKG